MAEHGGLRQDATCSEAAVGEGSRGTVDEVAIPMRMINAHVPQLIGGQSGRERLTSGQGAGPPRSVRREVDHGHDDAGSRGMRRPDYPQLALIMELLGHFLDQTPQLLHDQRGGTGRRRTGERRYGERRYGEAAVGRSAGGAGLRRRGPAFGGLDSGSPASVRRLVARPRRELALEPPRRRELVGRRPHAGAEPGEERRAEPRRLEHLRPRDRARRAGRPAAGRAGRWPPRRRRPRARAARPRPRAVIRSTTSRTSNAIASSVARTRCARVVPARDADDRAARARVPVRCAEPGERRHEDDAAGVRRRCGRAPRSRPREPMMPSPSRSHWTAAPVDEDRALERVRRACPSGCPQATVVSSPAPTGPASAPVLTRTNDPVPYVHFDVAGVEAGLAEQRRLLVAGDARRSAGRARGTPAGRCARRSPYDGTTSGSAAQRHPEQLAQLVGPARRRVMSNSRVREALDASVTCARPRGQPGDEVGVDGADGDRPRVTPAHARGSLRGQPAQLGGR